MSKLSLLFCTCFSAITISAASQIRFLGLSQTVGNQITVIYNLNNLGKINPKDTIYVVGVSSVHLFCVNQILSDSIEFYDFIGGEEYQENGKSLSYFNKRIKADYISTLPVGDYLLSRGMATFLSKNGFYVCLGTSSRLRMVKPHPNCVIREIGKTYDFFKGEIQTSDYRVPMTSFYSIQIVTDRNFSFAVGEDIDNKLKYFKFFLNEMLIAKIFEGVE